MAVFYVLLLFPMLIQHIAIKDHPISYQKRNKSAMKLFFFILTILIMFRHESVGSDTKNYARIFLNLSHMAVARADYEIGFVILGKAISLISKNPQVFFSIIAIIVSALIYPTYKRLCVDASLSIVLYCIMSTFVMMFSGLRQMIAIAIGFVAYDFVREKKKVHFVVTVLLAVTFHVSALMLAFMYPLYYAKITKKWLYVIVPVCAVIFAQNEIIFSILTVLMERFYKWDGGMTSTGAYAMLMLFILFTVFSFVIPDNSRLDAETVGMRNFLLLSLVIQMFAPLHTLVMRLSYYYIIFIPLLLPKIIQARSKRWNQVAILARHIMVIFFCLYFFISSHQTGALHVFPYHFFWENVQ